jgi:hypothetical protein
MLIIERAKLIFVSLNGKDIDIINLSLFVPGYFIHLCTPMDTPLVRSQTEMLELFRQVHPDSMTQLAEQPSPLRLFPSSH